MLEIEGLTVGYGAGVVLQNLTLTLKPGITLGVVGANGVGKSTLLKTIAGELPAIRGSIRFDGQDVTRVPTARRVSLGLALVPEGHQSFPAMSVLENLQLGTFGVPGSSRSNFGADLERAIDYFPALRTRLSQPAGTLSGGERQMLGLARALIRRPKALLLDEPSHGLAPLIVEELAETLKRISVDTPTLVVEQNLTIPRRCCEEIVVLGEGGVVIAGASGQVLDSPVVTSAYLGG